jgi:hypothetical protein
MLTAFDTVSTLTEIALTACDKTLTDCDSILTTFLTDVKSADVAAFATETIDTALLIALSAEVTCAERLVTY